MRLHQDAKIDRIRNLPLFRDADKTALQHIATAADEIQVRANTEIIAQGRFHHEGYIIVSGSVDVLIDDMVVATIGAGELVGELSLFGHGPASATVRTAEPVVALAIPFNRFDQLLDENPALLKGITKELAGRLHHMDESLRLRVGQ